MNQVFLHCLRSVVTQVFGAAGGMLEFAFDFLRMKRRQSRLENAQRPPAQVAKLVDARDLKSLGGNTVPVRFRPWAPSVENTGQPRPGLQMDTHPLVLLVGWQALR